MKKKILLLTLLLLTLVFVFVGCEGFGGGEDDTTPYKLSIKVEGYDGELTFNGYARIFDKDGDKYDDVTFSKVIKGPTNSVQVGEYTYQTRIVIQVPQIDGYKFLGWSDDKGNFLGGLDGTNVFDWNMYQRDGAIVAKYQKWSYNVTYVMADYDGLSIHNDLFNAGAFVTTNPTEYCPADDGDVVLTDGTTDQTKVSSQQDIGVLENYSFIRWVVANNDPTNPYTEITSLPKDYYEDNLAVFGEFQAKHCEVKLLFKDDIGEVIDFDGTVTVDGNVYTKTGEQCKLDENYETTVVYGGWMSLTLTDSEVEGHSFAGWYVNGEFAGAVSSIMFSPATTPIDGDMTIELRFDRELYDVSILGDNSLGTVTCDCDLSSKVFYGTTIVLTATPNQGGTFYGWYVPNGSLLELYSLESQLTITMEGNVELYPAFEPISQ